MISRRPSGRNGRPGWIHLDLTIIFSTEIAASPWVARVYGAYRDGKSVTERVAPSVRQTSARYCQCPPRRMVFETGRIGYSPLVLCTKALFFSCCPVFFILRNNEYLCFQRQHRRVFHHAPHTVCKALCFTLCPRHVSSVPHTSPYLRTLAATETLKKLYTPACRHDCEAAVPILHPPAPLFDRLSTFTNLRWGEKRVLLPCRYPHKMTR